jgi:hypothetical protein
MDASPSQTSDGGWQPCPAGTNGSCRAGLFKAGRTPGRKPSETGHFDTDMPAAVVMYTENATPPAGTVPVNALPVSRSVPEASTAASERVWLIANRKLCPSGANLRTRSTPGSAAATGDTPDSASSRSSSDSIPSRSGKVARYQAAPEPTARRVSDGTPSSGYPVKVWMASAPDRWTCSLQTDDTAPSLNLSWPPARSGWNSSTRTPRSSRKAPG